MTATYEHSTLEDLVPKIQEIVKAYRDQVLGAIGNCLPECDEIFLKEIREISPYDEANHSTPHYKDSWKVKSMRRTKFVSYIGNTKKVKGKNSETIPLINILEYTTRKNANGVPVARPVVNKALDNSKDQIINLIISNIGKAGK